MLLLLVVVVAALVALAVAGAVYQAMALRSDLRRFPPPGRLVDLGRHRLHLYETGTEGPTVVLESGISASSLNWRTVQSQVANFARVCSYDRAGLGWSELCRQPCTPSALADQLCSLLHAAAVPGPFVLVGHSFGALIVHAFAVKYADETVGLILVDPLDPAEWTPLTDERRKMITKAVSLSRRGALAARLGVVRMCLNLLIAGNRLVPRLAAKAWSGRASQVTDHIAGQVRKMPPETWPLVAMHWKQPKCFEGMEQHFECLSKSIAEMVGAPPVTVPVTVLAGGLNQHPTDPLACAMRISPSAKFSVAQKSGHWIQLDEPELVVEKVRELVEQARLTAGLTGR